MKYLFLALLLSASNAKSEEFNVGFNQGWIKENFEHQWTKADYDSKEVKRILNLNQAAGSKTIRIWLFEGVNSDALIWKDGKIAGLHPDFLKNFEQFLIESKKRGIKVYPTLFAPGALDNSTDKAINERWSNLFNEKFGAMDAFKKNALKPLMNLLNKEEYQSSIFGIDVANEIDGAVNHDKFNDNWNGANRFICSLKSEINPIPMTASMGIGKSVFVKPDKNIGVSRGAENIILDPNPHPDCVDFWDIHIYRDDGQIKNCEEIKALVKKYKKKIYLGEFGQSSKAFDDQLQKDNNLKFIASAKRCGFSGALAWSLSDVRKGFNAEARFSYESDSKSKTRPAYEVIRKNNYAETKCKKLGDECSIDECHLLSIHFELVNNKCTDLQVNESKTKQISINDSRTKASPSLPISEEIKNDSGATKK